VVNSDCIVIMGSNMAENHPVAFQWVVEAKLRGATVIHVDPRFTRTSALAHRHVPTRAGTDIVFLGALVNHVLSGGHYFRDYVVPYTNAAALVPEDFLDTEDLGGLFSGWDERSGCYDPASWQLTGERDETLEHPPGDRQALRADLALACYGRDDALPP
jgi:formate dehydrogenase major subunit